MLDKLRVLVPSFNVSTIPIDDAATLVRPANLRGLPPALRVGGLRLGMLVFACLFYGFFAGWLVVVQVQAYFGS